MITFKCRECGKRLFVKNELSGRRTQCPRCFKYLAVPVCSDKSYHLRGIAAVVLAIAIAFAIVRVVAFFKAGGWR
ncbi:MAG TPA: hypothetical protein VM141_03135 [Planctomycetota bacterium]|nr:hypothetical protein [Planctomycetota bacterium]